MEIKVGDTVRSIHGIYVSLERMEVIEINEDTAICFFKRFYDKTVECIHIKIPIRYLTTRLEFPVTSRWN